MSQISQFIDISTMSAILTLTGDAGGAVSPDGLGNLDLLGGTGISTTGTPASNLVTIDVDGTVATSYLTDDTNSAIPALNVLTVAGGTNIGTTSAGSTVTINLDDAITLTTVNATTFDTNVAAAGVTLSGTTLSADGTDADIDINITAKGTGHVIIDDLNISGLTAGTVRSDGSGNISSLADGNNGELLIGKTGDVPIWATLTDGNNITATEGANSISIAVTGTTDHAVQVGNASGSLTSLAVGATGEILIGNTGADASWSSTPTVTTIYATTFDTNVAAAGVTLSGTTLSADGTDADIDINITAKGTGHVIIDDLNISGLTAGTVRSDGSGNISALADGNNGELLIGKTGDVPIWATLTDGNNITCSEGANSISIAVTGTSQYAVQVGDATGSLDSLATGTQYQVLQSGGAAANPAWSTATYPATTSQGDVIYSSSANTIAGLAKDTNATRYLSNTGASNNPAWAQVNLTNGVTGTLPVGSGGTGDTTFTDHGVLLGSGAGAITATAAPTDGQLLIGNSGADPDLATLTAGSGISIANAGGSITISSSGGGIGWTEVTGTSQAMAVNSGYILNNAGLVTATLPATASVGDVIEVVGSGSGGWKIAQNAGQTIHFISSDTTTGATGSLASTNRYDSLALICITANTDFVVKSSVGNITVA